MSMRVCDALLAEYAEGRHTGENTLYSRLTDELCRAGLDRDPECLTYLRYRLTFIDLGSGVDCRQKGSWLARAKSMARNMMKPYAEYRVRDTRMGRDLFAFCFMSLFTEYCGRVSPDFTSFDEWKHWKDRFADVWRDMGLGDEGAEKITAKKVFSKLRSISRKEQRVLAVVEDSYGCICKASWVIIAGARKNAP